MYLKSTRKGVPTFSRARCPQVVNGTEDKPEGFLLFTGDAQHLHGCLQLGELLQGSLLVFRLKQIKSNFTEPCRESGILQ